MPVDNTKKLVTNAFINIKGRLTAVLDDLSSATKIGESKFLSKERVLENYSIISTYRKIKTKNFDQGLLTSMDIMAYLYICVKKDVKADKKALKKANPGDPPPDNREGLMDFIKKLVSHYPVDDEVADGIIEFCKADGKDPYKELKESIKDGKSFSRWVAESAVKFVTFLISAISSISTAITLVPATLVLNPAKNLVAEKLGDDMSPSDKAVNQAAFAITSPFVVPLLAVTATATLIAAKMLDKCIRKIIAKDIHLKEGLKLMHEITGHDAKTRAIPGFVVSDRGAKRTHSPQTAEL